MTIKKLVASVIVITFVLVAICSFIPAQVSSAGTPPTPIPIGWTPTPSGGGGGSSGTHSSSSSSSSLTFPIVYKIINSNGIVIGTATAYNYNDIRAHAEWNTTLGNDTEWAYVDATLNSIPTSDLRMDIALETPDTSKLPEFVNAEKILAQINFTKCSGWNVKDGSFKVTVKVAKSEIDGLNAGDSFYFIQINGGEYQLLKADIAGPDESGVMTYSVTTSRVSLSADGSTVFDLAALSSSQPTVTATATAIPTETPTATPSGSGISTFMLLLMVFIPAVIAGLIIVYYEMLRKGK